MPDDVQDGPDRVQLGEWLRGHRRRLPPVLRLSLAVAAGSAAGMLAVLAIAFLLDRHTGWLLLELIAWTTVSGPQSATLLVFAQDPPLGLGWALAMALLNLLATLALVVPLAWRGFERIRSTRFIGAAVRSGERYAVKHRQRLARWGLLGLAVVTALPVPGAGVLGAGILGVLMRVNLRRLLATLAVAGATATVAWTVSLKFTASTLPTSGPVSLAPYALILLIVAAGAWAAWKGRHERDHLHLETLSWITPERRADLRRAGVTQTAQLENVNLRRLSRRVGIPKDELGRARDAAGLLRLASLSPEHASRLAAVGVTSIRDLAIAPVELVLAALTEDAAWLGGHPPVRKQVEAWRTEAIQFQVDLARQDAGPS